MPIVSVDAMRQAFFRDAGATYGDIVSFSQPSDWKFLFTTMNNSARYVYLNFNTQLDGPVVLEVPAAVGAGLFGTMLDAWQVPLADIGPAGEDQGKGGKYLLLPPNFKGKVPAGYFPMRSETYDGYALFRAISESSSEADAAKAIALVKKLKLYPLSKAANPPPTRFVDMFGKMFDGIVRFDESFYASLAKMVNEEPALPRDKEILGALRTLGIEKGKEFKPDAATQAVLKQAATEAHAWFMDRLVTYGERYWPDGKWDIPVPPIGPKTEFKWEAADYFDVDARGISFFTYFSPPKKLGAATFYLTTFKERIDAHPHRGRRATCLR
jgi:hypothetical protein